MIRFFILSLVLHLFLGYLLVRKSTLVIEDPVVAVSLDLNQPIKTLPAKASLPSAKPTPSTQKASVSTESTPATETSSESNAQEAYQSGNVSVKPKVKKSYQISYPQEAKAARVEGAVKLSVIIDEDGLVKKVNVLEGPGYGLNEAASKALEQFVFSPAEVQGKKVSVQIVYVYRFRLESR